MTKYFLLEIDWGQVGFPVERSITEKDFELMLREHNPTGADQTLKIAKMTNGQYFFSPPGSQLEKRVVYRQVS